MGKVRKVMHLGAAQSGDFIHSCNRTWALLEVPNWTRRAITLIVEELSSRVQTIIF